ncbi:hypothetical protein LY76DRAFT_589216 [Colletotrichum caudatum]|nr:hypothetical protein LY76DRAFT_589216 [Colletotrichum caudatum]
MFPIHPFRCSSPPLAFLPDFSVPSAASLPLVDDRVLSVSSAPDSTPITGYLTPLRPLDADTTPPSR